ncbi:hypothetical protein L7F22_066605 [Adiantum nelumboides]|nr:hypothetical protein [Adiantum nelumboides]
MEELIRCARKVVINKLDFFEGKNISKFCKIYEQVMEDHGINECSSIENFVYITVSELRARITDIQGRHRVTWTNFKKALKEEFFLEDKDRVTKQNFQKWIHSPNKGMTAPKLLREFEKRYEQLSTREQQSLGGWREGELGLTTDWKDVAEAIGVIVKRQKRSDKLKMAHFLPSDEEAKPAEPQPKVSPKLDESILDKLVKGLHDLNLKTARLSEKILG